jgi:polyisoprenoid-binding protein YceI
VDFAIDPALGPTIRGRFGRVRGSLQAGAEGIEIELVVDATSVQTDNALVAGLLRSAEGSRLAEQPEARFRSSRIRGSEKGGLRVEGYLEAAGKTERVAFDAHMKPIEGGLELQAVAKVDRLGRSADRLAFLLPATVRVTARFTREDGSVNSPMTRPLSRKSIDATT